MTPADREEAPARAEPPRSDCARIDEIVVHWARHRPEAPALAEAGALRRYAELAADIDRAAAFLAGQGVGAGDRVLILLENGIAAAALILAATRLGAWAVPVNARLSAREIETLRSHARPRITLYTVGVSPDAATHAARDGAGDSDALAPLSVAFRTSAEDPAPEIESGPPRGRVAALLYTSGTTGAPKGVMLTHDNLLFIAERTSGLRRLESGDRTYLVLPISHVFGLASVLLGNLYRGARVDLAPRFQPEEVARAFAEDAITAFHGVPAMYAHLLTLAARRGGSLPAPSLRHLSVGGAPLDIALKRGVEAMLGVELQNGYGLTETSPTVSVTLAGEHCDDESVGAPLPDVEARIVDRAGQALPTGEIGELWIRGGLVMKGYFRDPSGTAEVLTPERWLRTGDLARQTADGRLYIVGRLKELIIRSGFNVYPAEVEAVIAGHPDVALAAVVGLRQGGNEEVVAFVQPQPGRRPETAELAAFAAERLAPYKRPSRYLLRPELPVTAAGKILKHKLKQELEGGPRDVP